MYFTESGKFHFVKDTAFTHCGDRGINLRKKALGRYNYWSALPLKASLEQCGSLVL